jgi:hypothetical protein
MDITQRLAKRTEIWVEQIVKTPDFEEDYSEIIYLFLAKKVKPVPFFTILKDFVFAKAGQAGDFRPMDTAACKSEIMKRFRENEAPFSLAPTTSKPSQVIGNMLKQQTVSRSGVFALGFGLAMTPEEVSAFLTRAILERDFNFTAVSEIIYYHCYRRGLRHKDAERLMRALGEPPAACGAPFASEREARDAYFSAAGEQSVINVLRRLKAAPIQAESAATTQFRSLFRKCQEAVARSGNKARQSGEPELLPESVSESAIANQICAGMPLDKYGNYKELSGSSLYPTLRCARQNKQRIGAILSGKTEADRSDITALSLLLAECECESDPSDTHRAFIETANRALRESRLSELSLAIPHDIFLIMCSLSSCPLAALADVWELSYENPAV